MNKQESIKYQVLDYVAQAMTGSKEFNKAPVEQREKVFASWKSNYENRKTQREDGIKDTIPSFWENKNLF